MTPEDRTLLEASRAFAAMLDAVANGRGGYPDPEDIADMLRRFASRLSEVLAHVEQVQPYMRHMPDCEVWLCETTVNDEGVEGLREGTCTCGLSGLLEKEPPQ